MPSDGSLLHCAHCRSTDVSAIVEVDETTLRELYAVACGHCSIRTAPLYTPAAARLVWNRRSSELAEATVAERVRRALRRYDGDVCFAILRADQLEALAAAARTTPHTCRAPACDLCNALAAAEKLP